MKPNFLDYVILYKNMFFIREVENLISNEYPNNKIRTPVHLATGQELLPALFSQLLEQKDKVVSGHRSHGHYLAKGGNLLAFFSELLGKEQGCCKGRGGSQHLVDVEAGFVASTPILGASVSIGTGCAWQIKTRKTGAVVVAYLGDAALEEGAVYESMSFAALHKLPIIFACENNQYSTHIKIDARQPNRSITRLVEGFGLSSTKIDHTNLSESFLKLRSIVSDARNFQTPHFILLDTYRFKEHVGPNDDFDLGYRTYEEAKYWFDTDPLIKVRELIVRDYKIAKTIEAYEDLTTKYVNQVYMEALNMPDAMENLDLSSEEVSA